MEKLHYNVKIDAFEGPLDLLLHLINRLEIDIYDIPVAEITEQYLLYIHTMKELELDLASEYLVMAATLLAIKSKMLLPKHEESLDDELEFAEEEDPRDELVERLIEYRKYKEAASDLKNLELERGLMFTKPPSDLSDYSSEVKTDKLDLDVSLYDMLGALQKLLRRKKLQRPLSTKITRQEIPIEQRMDEILQDLRVNKGRRSFFDLFPSNEKEYLVVTFLAILELMKRREIIVEQDSNFSDIFVMGKE
ncbi:segregation/condensation protein A [Robertmurraya andreesenii]|uniref:Segregation and condensation protein A n=1 Tax=Anoxybacillus andreesenii TaxID=1325932 RepID=A0ABT9V8D9_9BACL|nr:segregation/condensation protein A [Robertmurraya andreesenii]MDQ0157221.1 segregation and condensation protein A [Robertmurraya andreesenii]